MPTPALMLQRSSVPSIIHDVSMGRIILICSEKVYPGDTPAVTIAEKP